MSQKLKDFIGKCIADTDLRRLAMEDVATAVSRYAEETGSEFAPEEQQRIAEIVEVLLSSIGDLGGRLDEMVPTTETEMAEEELPGRDTPGYVGVG